MSRDSPLQVFEQASVTRDLLDFMREHDSSYRPNEYRALCDMVTGISPLDSLPLPPTEGLLPCPVSELAPTVSREEFLSSLILPVLTRSESNGKSSGLYGNNASGSDAVHGPQKEGDLTSDATPADGDVDGVASGNETDYSSGLSYGQAEGALKVLLKISSHLKRKRLSKLGTLESPAAKSAPLTSPTDTSQHSAVESTESCINSQQFVSPPSALNQVSEENGKAAPVERKVRFAESVADSSVQLSQHPVSERESPGAAAGTGQTWLAGLLADTEKSLSLDSGKVDDKTRGGDHRARHGRSGGNHGTSIEELLHQEDISNVNFAAEVSDISLNEKLEGDELDDEEDDEEELKWKRRPTRSTLSEDETRLIQHAMGVDSWQGLGRASPVMDDASRSRWQDHGQVSFGTSDVDYGVNLVKCIEMFPPSGLQGSGGPREASYVIGEDRRDPNNVIKRMI